MPRHLMPTHERFRAEISCFSWDQAHGLRSKTFLNSSHTRKEQTRPLSDRLRMMNKTENAGGQIP